MKFLSKKKCSVISKWPAKEELKRKKINRYIKQNNNMEKNKFIPPKNHIHLF